jgi:hypothetical protein
MKTSKHILFIALLISFMSATSVAQQKLAQSGFQFLSVVSDARGAAIGQATTSLRLGSSSMFFNPAGMAELGSFVDVSASTNKWIAGITHTTFSAAISPEHGNYGVVGMTLQYVNYGEFFGTVVNNASPQGYDDTGIFKLNALAIGLGYAKQLTEQFSIGGQVKWVHQDLGMSIIPVASASDTVGQGTSNKLSPLAFDIGTQFKTGIKSIVFGMSVRNFSTEVKYAQEGMQTPLAFTIGISMNVMDLVDELPFDQSLLVSIDASHYLDHPEQVKIGLEYRLLDMISLRGGYASSTDEGSGLSFGLGASKYGVSIDYAYSPFGIFNNVQRFTARFAM